MNAPARRSWIQAVRDHDTAHTPPTAANGTPGPAQGDTPYGMTALADECDQLAHAPEGTRNDRLNTAAFKIGRIIAAGHLTHTTAADNLEAAARAAGLPTSEIQATLASGLGAGQQHPRAVPDLEPAPDLTPFTPPTPGDDQADAHTSWYFRDLTGVLDGTHTEPGPVHLTRDDGNALFYAGKVNGLLGESESGKTWVALHAAVQALQGGERVLYLDFEDTASGIVQRLQALGATTTDLARFAYIDPDETLHIAARADLAVVLETHQPALIVLDGFNAAMTLLGLDLQSNTDATRFAQTLLRPLSKAGATVIYIDHLPKNREAQGKGGIGAQAKRAMTTGCALRVDVVQEFGRGMVGRLKLTVDKDRAGHVRAISSGARNAGTAVIDSTNGHTVMRIEAPDLRPVEERGPFRPTHLMEAVSRFLETTPGAPSGAAIEAAVTGKRDYIRAAVNALVEEGHVVRETAGKGLAHRSVTPFRELTPTSPHLAPTSPRGEQNTATTPRPSPPTLGGGEGEVAGEDQGHLHLAPPNQGEEDEPWWQK